jgi:hypothetical protein
LDIYKCVKLPNGKWSKATNLGPSINTEYDEDGPFIHPNKVDLFFSSKGHKTMGGYDIFFSTFNPDSSKWSEPINIGYPINTTDDDIFYVTTPDGKRAYYSSARPGGFGETDIYVVKFQQSVPEKAVALIKGYITTADGSEIPMDIVIVATDSATGEQVSSTKPIHRTGSYSIILEPGRTYKLSYLVNGAEISSEMIPIPAGADYKYYDRPLLLNNLTIPNPKAAVKDTAVVVKIPKIKAEPLSHKQVTYNGGHEFRLYFPYNEHAIDQNNANFSKFMDSVAAVVKEKGTLSLLISGSASQVPTKAFNGNRALAMQRAVDGKESMLIALKAHGIDESKVQFKLRAEINGPPFKFDAQQNKETYYKHQYLSVKFASK